MVDDTQLELVRRGDIEPDEVWTIVAPALDTERKADATKVYGALRSWTWKALDRRRRDAGLNAWATLLNNAEACLRVRFPELATRLVALVELIHESIAVAALPVDGVVERKNVSEIMSRLASRGTDWVDRRELMDAVGLKAANATRLMGLLADVGYVEQCRRGRELAYRLSSEGRRHVPAAARARTGPSVVPAVVAMSHMADVGSDATHIEYMHAVRRSGPLIGPSRISEQMAEFEIVLDEAADALIRAAVSELGDDALHDGLDTHDWATVPTYAPIYAGSARH